MFSGIVLASSSCLRVENHLAGWRIFFKITHELKDMREGDSLSVDGVCLTVESLKNKEISLFLGAETLKITGWNESILKNKKFNLEPSLKMGGFIGGHILSGHVDGLATVTKFEDVDAGWSLALEIPKDYLCFFWKKAYIALNGVSLTVNEVKGSEIKLCLIPKTLEKTNLSDIQVGDKLNFEVDYLARNAVEANKVVKD